MGPRAPVHPHIGAAAENERTRRRASACFSRGPAAARRAYDADSGTRGRGGAGKMPSAGRCLSRILRSSASAAPKCHAAPTFSSAETGSPSSETSDGSCCATCTRYGTASEPQCTTGLSDRSSVRSSARCATCLISFEFATALRPACRSISPLQPCSPASELRRLSLTSRAVRCARAGRPSSRSIALCAARTVARSGAPSRPPTERRPFDSTHSSARHSSVPRPSRLSSALCDRSSVRSCRCALTALAVRTRLCERLSSCRLSGGSKSAPAASSVLKDASRTSKWRSAPSGCSDESLLCERSSMCSDTHRATSDASLA
mmetsp:Transcript_5371/g.16843  ORF Transcript_5371/g.16843 Transcript_5371/m.16843 type:complete len:318 (-) Transcript_5371:107-1060(-)